MSQDEGENRTSVVLLALLMLFIGGFLLFNPGVFDSKDSASVNPDDLIDQKIDRNLKATSIQKELEAIKVRIANEKAEALKAYDLEGTDFEAPGGMETLQESHGESITRENEEAIQGNDDGFLNPSEIINRRLAREQFLQDYDEKYQKLYIREFLKRARDQGYEVRLNDNLEVVDILEVPTDEAMRFPNSVPGGKGGAAQ